MGRTRRDCPLCPVTGLLKLSNHLTEKHDLKTPEKRRPFLKQRGAGKKRLYSDLSDEDSYNEEDSEDFQSDDDTEGESTYTDEDTGEDSDEENDDFDPWSDVVDETFDQHLDDMEDKYKELMEDTTEKKALNNVVKVMSRQLTETLQEKVVKVLKSMHYWRKDSTCVKIMETARRMRIEDDMDWDESIEQAVERRKVLLSRELNRYTPNLSTDTDDDEEKSAASD